MKRLPQIGWLADGRRLHLQDGPIDLIVEADGNETHLRRAYHAAARNSVSSAQSSSSRPVKRHAAA